LGDALIVARLSQQAGVAIASPVSLVFFELHAMAVAVDVFLLKRRLVEIGRSHLLVAVLGVVRFLLLVSPLRLLILPQVGLFVVCSVRSTSVRLVDVVVVSLHRSGSLALSMAGLAAADQAKQADEERSGDNEDDRLD